MEVSHGGKGLHLPCLGYDWGPQIVPLCTSYPGLLSPGVDESEDSRGSRSHLRASGLPLSLSGLRVPTAWSLADSTEFSLRVRTGVVALARLLCHVLLGTDCYIVFS